MSGSGLGITSPRREVLCVRRNAGKGLMPEGGGHPRGLTLAGSISCAPFIQPLTIGWVIVSIAPVIAFWRFQSPTQTPAAYCGETPIIQPSFASLVVPVLKPKCQPL